MMLRHNTPFLNTSVLRALAIAVAAASIGSNTASAQSTVVPVPFVTTYAGIPAGGTSTACSTATDIPNNAGLHTGDGCLPSQATLAGLYGGFTDTIGNVYITENSGNTDIRVIYKGGATLTAMLIAANANLTNFTPVPGRIYTLAGGLPAALTVKTGSKYSCNGTATGAAALDSSGNGCPAAQAYLKPRGMAVDSLGNVYFVNNSPGILLRVIYAGGAQVAALITAENPGVTPQVGYVYKLSGQSAGSYNGDGAIASAAAFDIPRDVVVDSNFNIYLSDGTSTTASGNSVRVIYGGVAAPAGIANPTLGFIYTFAGAAGCAQGATTCTAGDTGDLGPATAATINGPYNLFVDRYNNLFLTEYLSGRLRVVYNSGTIGGITNPTPGYIYTYAGGGAAGSTADNTAANQLAFGVGTQTSGVDAAGNIYLEDATTKRLWRFDAATAVGYVIAGRTSGSAPLVGVSCTGTGTGAPLSTDTYGDGCPGPQAALSDVGRVSFDPQGNIYLGENGNAIVRRLSYNLQFPTTNVAATSTQSLAFKSIAAATLATESITQQGNTTTDFTDPGTGTCAATSTLTAAQVCVFNLNFTPSHDGLRTAAFQLNTTTATSTIDLISGVGVAAELAIDPATKASAGTGLTPSGVVTDLFGNIYVADAAGNRVLKGSTAGTTLTPLVTGLKAPGGLALDTFGNLYIADTGNNRVLETTATGTTIAMLGTGFSGPQGVAVDVLNNVFVSDTGNNRIVEVFPNGQQAIFTGITGLAVPTQLTFDTLGNLYVSDTGNSRLVEYAVNANQSVVTLPAGVKPTGIAVDPAGTIYVTDAASLQLYEVAPGGAATGTVLLSGLVKPAALAADPDGNLYLADTGVTSATYLRRNLANVTFPITNVNQTSTAPVTVNNVGNAAFNFPTTTLYTRTGSTAFTLAPATTNGCGSGISYAAGANCAFTASFTPTTTGAATASVTFNTTAANTTTAKALLTGNGQQLVATTSTIAVTSPTGTIAYGQAVTVTASVTPVTNAGAPTGTVTFTVDNTAQTPVPYGTGTYALTLNPGVGSHTVSVAFSGDGIYASSSATTNFTIVKASTTTALTVTPTNSNGTTTLVFTAVVSSATAIGETGTVTFYSGATALATVPLITATRTATYSTSALTFATNSFTAVYSGDTNFATSSSLIMTPTGDFSIGTSTTAVTIPQGGVGNLSYSLAPVFGGTGTVTPSCTGLPANSLCRFFPATISLSGTATSVQVQIYTNVSATLASNTHAPLRERTELMLAALFPLSLFAFARRSRRMRGLALGCFVLLLTTLPLTGCGAGSPAATQSKGLITPTGTVTVQVVFTGGTPLGTHSAPLALTITTNTTGI